MFKYAYKLKTSILLYKKVEEKIELELFVTKYINTNFNLALLYNISFSPLQEYHYYRRGKPN